VVGEPSGFTVSGRRTPGGRRHGGGWGGVLGLRVAALGRGCVAVALVALVVLGSHLSAAAGGLLGGSSWGHFRFFFFRNLAS